jgi:hypothetical protein
MANKQKIATAIIFVLELMFIIITRDTIFPARFLLRIVNLAALSATMRRGITKFFREAKNNNQLENLLNIARGMINSYLKYQ